VQDKNQTKEDFFRRTSALASQMGQSLDEVAGFIGISRAMFFSYRSGAKPISHKAWRKLALAEERATLDKNSLKKDISDEIGRRIAAGPEAVAKEATDEELIEEVDRYWSEFKEAQRPWNRSWKVETVFILVSELRSRVKKNKG
jgi:hypothetical protein